MNDSSITDNNGYISSDSNLMSLITPDVSAEVKTLSDLWSLAKMVKDVAGDRIWDVLFQMGCNPSPFDNLGYVFDYSGFSGIYFPAKNERGTIRFVLPRLYDTKHKTKEELADIVNTANSLVTESKFTLMDDEIWIVHERYLYDGEDYESIVSHILENLDNGARIFHDLCKKSL